MVKTYRIAHLEHKLIKALVLLEELECKLPIRCPRSVWAILGDLRRILSTDYDTDVSAPPTE